MLRILSAAFAALVLTSLAAQAADTAYRDPSGRFTVTVPDGWVGEPIGDTRLALVISAPGADDFGGLCIVSVSDIPQMRSLTQAQIDEVFAKEINRTFWETAYRASNAKDVVVEDFGMREQNGHKAYFAVASATVSLPTGGVVSAKGKTQIQVIPGSTHIINCRAKAEVFASHIPQFETVLSSHVPLGSAVIASLPRTGGVPVGLSTSRPDARANVIAARAMVSHVLEMAQAPRRRR
jgi:hypothetical protein